MPGEDEMRGSQPNGQRHESTVAGEATCRAKAEFEKAREYCERLRDEAAERLRRVRQTTVGDLLDAARAGVQRRPGVGLAVAAAAGFFLGRWFKR